MVKNYRAKGVRFSKEKENEPLKKGQFWIGELMDREQPEWVETYQKIIDKFQK